MYNSEMDVGYINDTVSDFIDYLISTHTQVNQENKEQIIKDYQETTFIRNYKEDFRKVATLFDPIVPHIKETVDMMIKDFPEKEYDSISYYMKKDKLTYFWGGGYVYAPETFNVYINKAIKLPDGYRIKLYSRYYDDFEGRYSYNLELRKGRYADTSSLEKKLEELYDIFFSGTCGD